MKTEAIVEQLFQHLVSGHRTDTARFVTTVRNQGISSEALVNEVFWPLHEMLVKLHKHGQLSRLNYNYATRLLRQTSCVTAKEHVKGPSRQQRVLLFCGPTEGEELGAQLATDLLEAAGFEVYFGGAGVANDEILGELRELKPTYLVMWASAAQDAPAIRELIDTVREIGGHPNLKIVCGGGVFNRAQGLAEEIGAHATASTPAALVGTLTNADIAATRAAKTATAGTTAGTTAAARTTRTARTAKVA